MTDTMSGKVPVIACVRQAWIFLLQNWRLFLPAAGICAAIAQIGIVASLMVGAPGGQAGLFALIPALLASLMFAAAVLRKAVRDEYTQPVGLSLGADEARLFGVGVNLALILIPVVFIGGIIFTATVLSRVASTPEAMEALAENPEAMMKAIEEAIGPTGLAILESVWLLILSVMMGIVAFVQAATTGEKRVVIFQALRWTGGNLLRVLGAIILTVMPTVCISMGVSLGLLPLADNVPAYIVLSVVVSFVGNLVSIPVAALGAIFYKGLRPPGFVPK